jgi:hypothetical protein
MGGGGLTRRGFQGVAAGAAAAAAAALGAAGRARAADFRASDRRCATCDFWRGARTASADRQTVTVADGTTGICSNPQSPLYNRPTRPDQVFNQGYRKWADLG